MSIRNKAKTAAIIVTVLLMTSVMFMAVQIQPVEAVAALAAEQPRAGALPSGVTVQATMTPQAYLSFRPNPIGVGQRVFPVKCLVFLCRRFCFIKIIQAIKSVSCFRGIA